MKQIRAKVPLRIVALATLLLGIGVISTQTLASADATVDCTYETATDWGTGFVASITISNTSSTELDGWEVDFELPAGSTVAHAWGATVDGTNPYTATAMSWNAKLAPGQTANMGFVGDGEGSTGTITRCEANDTGNPGTTTTTNPTTTTTDPTTTTTADPTTTTTADPTTTTTTQPSATTTTTSPSGSTTTTTTDPSAYRRSTSPLSRTPFSVRKRSVTRAGGIARVAHIDGLNPKAI